jgi:hypothetical protein
MKRRMGSRVFFIMGLLVMDLCCASCGINGTEEISPVAESTSLLIDLKTSSSATSSSPATFKTTVSAYTTPSTTAPKTTASAYTAPETSAQNPYEGEMAKIYEQAVWVTAASAENHYMWHTPYQDLSVYFLPEDDGKFSLPLENFIKLNLVCREYLRLLNESIGRGGSRDFKMEHRVYGLEVDGSKAEIHLQAGASFYIDGAGADSFIEDVYTLTFMQSDGQCLSMT